MKFKYITLITSMLVLMSTLCGCSLINDDVPDSPLGDGEVLLRLRLEVPSSISDAEKRVGGLPTRADDEYDFEGPSYDWEWVRTLRVIIVRADHDNEVEYNRFFTLTDAEISRKVMNQLEFEVHGNEKKLIYFIANEESLSRSAIDLLKGIPAGEGTKLPEEINSLTIGSSASGSVPSASDLVMIDNTGSEDSNKWVPVTEVFEYEVGSGELRDKDTYVVEAGFFITRSAVKFSFALDVENSVFWPADQKGDPMALLANNWEVDEITISGLADREYLFPTGTTYSPEKYQPSTNKLGGRLITEYECPGDVQTGSFSFTPSGFGFSGSADSGLVSTWAPALYFFESPVPADDKGYTISMTIKRKLPAAPGNNTGEDSAEGNSGASAQADESSEPEYEYFTFEPVKLPNLASLPRNTHVKIKIRLQGHSLNCQAILLPYIGISLDPEFGLDLPEQTTK